MTVWWKAAALPFPRRLRLTTFTSPRARAVVAAAAGVLGLFGVSNARFIDGMAVDHTVRRLLLSVAAGLVLFPRIWSRHENNDGFIELSELVKYVQKVVPGIAKGIAKGLARTVTQSEAVFGVQTPRFGSIGGDFALVKKLP